MHESTACTQPNLSQHTVPHSKKREDLGSKIKLMNKKKNGIVNNQEKSRGYFRAETYCIHLRKKNQFSFLELITYVIQKNREVKAERWNGRTHKHAAPPSHMEKHSFFKKCCHS